MSPTGDWPVPERRGGSGAYGPCLDPRSHATHVQEGQLRVGCLIKQLTMRLGRFK